MDGSTLLKHLEQVKQDVRLRPGYRSFFDLSKAVPGAEIDGEFVRRAAEVARRFDAQTGAVRVAVLAPTDVTFGLARMSATLVDSLQREVRVFREAAEAHAWLCGHEAEAETAG